jgi:membrane protein DedA with SNARE-associated domain
MVFATRTLISSLSSPVSLVAGMNHYRLVTFCVLVLLRRIIWTVAYVGLGYSIGGSLESATGFLANLSGLVLSLVVLAGAALVGSGVSARWVGSQVCPARGRGTREGKIRGQNRFN